MGEPRLPYNIRYLLKEEKSSLDKLKDCCFWAIEFLHVLVEQRTDSYQEISNYSHEDIVKHHEKCMQLVNSNLKWVQEILNFNFHCEATFFKEIDITSSNANLYIEKINSINTDLYETNTASSTFSLLSQSTNCPSDVKHVSTSSLSEVIEDEISKNLSTTNLNKILENDCNINVTPKQISLESSEESCVPKTDTDIIIASATESLSLSDSATINTKPKSSSVSEKAPAEVFLSRRDRYVQSLPKVHMPDLSFIRTKSNLSGSEYVSFSDSTSEPTKKNKRKKKFKPLVTNDSDSTTTSGGGADKVVVKTKKTKIQEAELPNANDICGISFFMSPSEFYIHVSNENTDIIESLGMQLNEWCRQKAVDYPTKDDAIEAIGQYCLVYIGEWKAWYRAEVLNWMLSVPNNVQVKLLDYGEKHVISYKFLRILPDDYCYYPKLAVQCHLASIYSVGSAEDDLRRHWSDAALDEFAKLLDIGAGDECFRLVFVDAQADSVAVDIIKIQETNEELTIGQLFINSGHGVQIIVDPTLVVKDSFMINQIKTCQGVIGISKDMTESEALDVYYGNEQINEASNLVEAMTAYDAKDEQRICPYTQTDGTCFKGKNCRLEHVQLRKDGYTTDKQLTFICANSVLPLPSIGEEITILITYMVDVHHFYGHLQSASNRGYHLKKLMEMMNSSVAIRAYKPFKILPSLGELVIAKYADGKWCRAMVTEFEANIESQNTMEVFFVDFGEPMEISFSDVRQMEDIYLDVPYQAVSFLLQNVMPNSADKDEVREYFESSFLYQELQAKVQYAGFGFLEVNVSDVHGRDIGQQIIKAGFGKLKTENHIPKQTEKLLIE